MKNAKYIRLYQWLKKQIVDGEMGPGSKVYSELKLADMFQISRQTVRQGISLLENEGLVTRVQGSGTYVTEQSGKYIRRNTKVIGVIMTYVDDYIFPSIISGINAYLAEAGYTINLYITYNRRCNEEKILRTIMESQVDGLIIEPTKSNLINTNKELYEQLACKLPCILVNCYYPSLDLPYVMPDNVESVRLITNYLIERGHRRIAGIFKIDDEQGNLRFAGYAQALQENGLTVDDELLVWYQTEFFDYIFEGKWGENILTQIKKCTAVVCYNDQIAVKLISFMRRYGIEVPRDISVVGFDDALLSLIEVPLTTMAHPKEMAGRVAAQNLLHLIDNPSADASFVFPPQLVERQSVRDLRKD